MLFFPQPAIAVNLYQMISILANLGVTGLSQFPSQRFVFQALLSIMHRVY
jgi:hypothetical protein